MSPTRFIPIAKDCGLIGPLTDALLAKAGGRLLVA